MSRRGFSIPELLVVMTIIAMAVIVTIPMTVRTVRSLEVRSATDKFTVTLRAARMQAVARNRPVNVTVYEDDAGDYWELSDVGYVAREGEGEDDDEEVPGYNTRRWYLPSGVWFTSPAAGDDAWEGTLEIRFNPNGSLEEGPRTVILETRLGSDGSNGTLYERWITTTNVIGATAITHEEVTQP
jgi:prepilin-type N-terminal cleavage/methylation domain-containing protein